MKNYSIEFIGTFFLVLTIAFTGNPLAIGAILAVLVYMGGPISGAHYNPAVTTSMLIAKKITAMNALIYIFFQIIGALAASIVFFGIQGSLFIPQPGVDVGFTTAFIMEMLFTFLLCFVVLNVTSSKHKGNQYFGIAIGATVGVGALVAGPLSGAVFNPAVAYGSMLIDINNINFHANNLVLYTLAPLFGALVATLLFRAVSK